MWTRTTLLDPLAWCRFVATAALAAGTGCGGSDGSPASGSQPTGAAARASDETGDTDTALPGTTGGTAGRARAGSAAGTGGELTASGGAGGTFGGGAGGATGGAGGIPGGAGGSGVQAGESGGAPTADCQALVTDPSINWRESALQTDQEIVQCLYETLGRPVGYGENAMGGYDPGGNSRLVVIRKDQEQSVEEQIHSAVSSSEHNWIVFDKDDFAQEYEVGMYRLSCGDADVLAAIGGTEDECLDYRKWCDSRGHTAETECLEQFFNHALDDSALPIRNPVIASNTTLDGRSTNAYFRFSGFAIGSDSSGEPVDTATSVILTHLEFRGAGHTEDHGLDPDMIRSTGASHDIWIHKNTFDLTGDSAFDVKVGAYGITISFNRVMDVKRASLHGSSDSREINSQITTTLHHNAFVTRDALYDAFGNTGRRVPLIRRGTSHMWNNFFLNYRKDVVSVRVGASLLWQDNALLIHSVHQEDIGERASELTRDVDGGNYRGDGVYLWLSDASCNLEQDTQTPLTDASGTVADLVAAYSPTSRAITDSVRMAAGQDLVDYVNATAGKHGETPFNSPLGAAVSDVVASAGAACQ